MSILDAHSELDTKMQDFDINSQEAEAQAEPNLQLEMLKEQSRLLLKRLVAFICFGPGVLGFLWLMSRILRR